MVMDLDTVAIRTTKSVTLSSGRTPTRVRPLRRGLSVCVEEGSTAGGDLRFGLLPLDGEVTSS